MSKRFGRNQRRRAREEIARLSSENTNLARKAQYAEWRAANARQEAFDQFVHHSAIYETAINQCSNSLGIALAEQLNEHKEKLLPMVIKEPMRFSYRIDYGVEEMHVVEVCIPLKELRYRTIVPEQHRS